MPAPKPFLKWAGGKGQLLAQITPLLPAEFKGYHEPFVGSAAVFFHLAGLRQAGQVGSRLSRVYLSDSNEELINCYRVVRAEVEPLIALLAEHKRHHSHDYYYAVRRLQPAQLSALELAARLIYLNKTCFNGLYRVNRQGQFNVPVGRYANPAIFDPANLRAASRALQSAHVAVAGFRQVIDRARPGDFVYFDPPYYPLSRTASFTAYTDAVFLEAEQQALAQVYRELDRRGVRVMLSNSWTPFVLDLYAGFTRLAVSAGRAINSNPARRGKISELVVINYPLCPEPVDSMVTTEKE